VLKKSFFVYIFFTFFIVTISAQTHTSVPLGEPIYYILEQAHMRGFCSNLPSAKPYSRAAILRYIEEILSHEGSRSLSEAERRILEEYRTAFSPPNQGLNLSRGSYYFEHNKDDFRFTGNFGINFDLLFSGGFYPNGGRNVEENEFIWSTDNWLTINAEGDIGYNFSYGLLVYGGILRVPRVELGQYNTYYAGYKDDDPNSQYKNQEITTYSEPLSFFPYSYRKRWDAYVYDVNNVSSSGAESWPESLSIGWGMLAELSGTLFSDHLSYRIGRLSREWGGITNGGSLVLNESARPFIAFEASLTPIDWFSFSTMTGVLEYYKLAGSKSSAESSQNAFSVNMVELNYKNYFHLDFGSSAVWPKRFELGYIFPLFDNFLYQSNIGDFDNMALFFNLRGQYPGIGKIWISFFADEINMGDIKRIFELDRQMFAFQLGVSAVIPWIPFSSIKFSYTKIEPYNYTHTREFVPWYGTIAMETNYVNNGVSLGYYLPPNSDEILVRLESVPHNRSLVYLQYQLIRHGADYGSRAVDGSSFWSELDPDNRSSNPILEKHFLKDGAYQWMHIIRLGGELSISRPIKLFGEAGFVYSYFTDISGKVNSDYSTINTYEYPQSTAFIATLGVRIFPNY
jgi:hypothetical protein